MYFSWLNRYWKFQTNLLLRSLTIDDNPNVFHSVKPTLKKVSKYENKFAKLQKKAAEFNFRNQLKVVKKKEFTLEEEDKEVIYFTVYLNFHDFHSYLKILSYPTNNVQRKRS